MFWLLRDTLLALASYESLLPLPCLPIRLHHPTTRSGHVTGTCCPRLATSPPTPLASHHLSRRLHSHLTTSRADSARVSPPLTPTPLASHHLFAEWQPIDPHTTDPTFANFPRRKKSKLMRGGKNSHYEHRRWDGGGMKLMPVRGRSRNAARELDFLPCCNCSQVGNFGTHRATCKRASHEEARRGREIRGLN